MLNAVHRGAEDEDGNPVDITAWKTVNNFNFPNYKPVFTEADCRVDVDWPDKTGKEFEIDFWEVNIEAHYAENTVARFLFLLHL